jgi:hypothetical protein
MNEVSVDKENTQVTGHLNDETVSREIGYLDPSRDEGMEPHRRPGTLKKMLEISCIVLLYAVSIAALVAAVLRAM